MKKNLCILGTSPLMTLIFYRLYKNFNITIYDYKDHTGGAWSYNYFNKISYSNFNNIIIPDNYEEDKVINKINKEFEKYKCKVNLPLIPVKPKYKYKAKNIYLHDFSNFFDLVKKEDVIIKNKINLMIIEKDKITLNNKTYDYLFLPSCFEIKNIYLEKKKYDLKNFNVKSSHLSVFFGESKLPLCTYDDDFDNIFDRAQVKNLNKNFIFTGRIRKKFKNENIEFFLNQSKFLKKYSNYIINYRLVYYDHKIIENNTLKIFKKKIKEYPVSIVETRQLNHGYLTLEKSIKKLNLNLSNKI